MKNSKISRLLLRAVVCALVALMLVSTVSVSAVSEKTDEMGYDSYTYWYNFTGRTNRVVPTKPMYEPVTVHSSIDLGCISGSAIEDVHVSKSGITYILDGGASRVLLLDEDYNIQSQFNYVLAEDGARLYFNK